MKKTVRAWMLVLFLGTMAAVVFVSAKGQQETKKSTIKLSYWSHWYNNNPKFCDWYSQAAKDFTKVHPEVDLSVEVVPINYQSYVAKYLSAFEVGKDAPDIFNGLAHQWAGQYDYADPMPREIAANMERHLLPYQRVVGVWNGVRYGRPVEGGNFIMMYLNVDMFKEAGLDPEKYPKTYDELLDVAKKLTKREGDRVVRAGIGVRYGGSKVGIADKFLPRLHAWDALYYNAKERKASGYINSKNAVDALRAYGELIFKHKVASTDIDNPTGAFGNQTAAMIAGNESWYVGWLQQNAPSINFRVVPLPKQLKEAGIGTNFPWADMVYKQAPPSHKKWAWKFIDFISQPEQEYSQHASSGVMTTYTENLEKEAFRNRPDYQAIKIMTSGPVGPHAEYYYCEQHQELFEVAADAITSVLFGRKTAQAACDEAAMKMDRILNP